MDPGLNVPELNKSIVDVNLEPRTVLILEEDEAADPLDYLSSSSKVI